MPIGSLKLNPGVNFEQTPALNETGFAGSNLIRWRDGLPEKIGGWVRYYPYSLPSPIRMLHPWKDLSDTSRLAVGAVNQLALIDAGTLKDITPTDRTSDVAPGFSTTNGSASVTVTDVGSNATTNDVIQLKTPIAIGGLILNGVYRIVSVLSADTYTITAASLATSTAGPGGAVPSFATTSGSTVVTVTLTGHGLLVGSSFAFLASTTVGGLTIQGIFTVTGVPTANTFTIALPSQATSTTTGSMNGGDAQIYYFLTAAPPSAGSGYGAGGYGSGGYGTGSSSPGSPGTPITATEWNLDNWGSIIVASPGGGALYTWAADSNLDSAAVIPEAPTASRGFFVAMPQQQIMVYGASVLGIKDPLLIAWCDVGDFNTWTAQSINQAGTYRIPRGSELIGGRQMAQQSLFWTDLGLWAAQYIGPSEVYGFQEIGVGCGLIAEFAHTALGALVLWMGPKNFHAMPSGGAPQVLPCPVWDAVFQNLNTTYKDNIRAAANTQFSEITWYYPSNSSVDGENDSYVKYNVMQNVWDYGMLARSAWVDQSILGNPIGAGDQLIFEHEIGYNGDDAPISASFTTGYFMLDEGGRKVIVDLIWPDFKFDVFGQTGSATLQLTVFVRDYPDDTPVVHGPFEIQRSTRWVNTRMRGRMMAIQISSGDLSTFWRLGNFRYRYAEDGRR